MRIAFVCLTRGYLDKSLYCDLIERNKSILPFMEQLNAKNVIFHEGNISEDHQNYIQQFSPAEFINLQKKENISAFKSNRSSESTKIIYETNLSKAFPIGYRHMCHFWTKDFLELVKCYDYIIRVDEDCVIRNIPTSFITKSFAFITATYNGLDTKEVTIGLQETLTNFHKKYGTQEKQSLQTCYRNPYTNVFIMNVASFRDNEIFKKYVDYIDESNGIYINRWGDLPLLGYFLQNFIDHDMYVRDMNIKYYHKSHNKEVNARNL